MCAESSAVNKFLLTSMNHFIFQQTLKNAAIPDKTTDNKFDLNRTHLFVPWGYWRAE